VKLEIEVNVDDDGVGKAGLQEYLCKEAILALFADRSCTGRMTTSEPT